MDNLRNGGPAFPGITVNDSDLNLSDPFGTLLAPSTQATYSGATLRDFFAAKAIPLAARWEEAAPTYDEGQNPTFRGVAERAYLMADAMLKARQS